MVQALLGPVPSQHVEKLADLQSKSGTPENSPLFNSHIMAYKGMGKIFVQYFIIKIVRILIQNSLEF